MFRALLLTHRYLGIGVGLFMALWCLSGFVMLYMPYPQLSQVESLRGLEPLSIDRCCRTGSFDDLGLVDVNRFRIEMAAGQPVIRFQASSGQNPIVDLASGQPIANFDASRSRDIAQDYREHADVAGELVTQERVRADQWTVTNLYNRDRPLYRFGFDDPAQTQVYVSSTRGTLVQKTTAKQRFWNWLGAIPHWLYPKFLRQHDTLWAQVVIWLSLLGTFLTVFGLYLGVVRFKRLPSGRRSPYRGVGLWHHYAGLIFGFFILTWIASGLLSMNPWGLFDLSGGTKVRTELRGIPLSSRDVETFVKRLPQLPLPDDTRRLEGYALDSNFYLLAFNGKGDFQRLQTGNLASAPINGQEWQRLTTLAAGGRPVAEAGMLSREDAYYYRQHETPNLPVYRIILDTPDRTRLYLDGRSGQLVGHYDTQQRWYRWLFSGLHELDLASWLRTRPLWDIIVWFLLSGVTLGTLTGVYMAYRRVKPKR